MSRWLLGTRQGTETIIGLLFFRSPQGPIGTCVVASHAWNSRHHCHNSSRRVPFKESLWYHRSSPVTIRSRRHPPRTIAVPIFAASVAPQMNYPRDFYWYRPEGGRERRSSRVAFDREEFRSRKTRRWKVNEGRCKSYYTLYRLVDSVIKKRKRIVILFRLIY